MLPPTLCEGEFELKKAGCSFSNFSNSFKVLSKSKSEIVALSKT